MNETELIACRHCDFEFIVKFNGTPVRNGLYCPECSEYLPYAHNPLSKIDFNKAAAEATKYLATPEGRAAFLTCVNETREASARLTESMRIKPEDLKRRYT